MAIQGPDGKFYLYYQRDITGTHVAVSDSPEGPWKAVRGAGLNDNADAIHTKAAWNYKGMHDADVFRDDDGKYYLTFNGPGQKGISSVDIRRRTYYRPCGCRLHVWLCERTHYRDDQRR